jgi:hypothetical protein
MDDLMARFVGWEPPSELLWALLERGKEVSPEFPTDEKRLSVATDDTWLHEEIDQHVNPELHMLKVALAGLYAEMTAGLRRRADLPYALWFFRLKANLAAEMAAIEPAEAIVRDAGLIRQLAGSPPSETLMGLLESAVQAHRATDGPSMHVSVGHADSQYGALMAATGLDDGVGIEADLALHVCKVAFLGFYSELPSEARAWVPGLVDWYTELHVQTIKTLFAPKVAEKILQSLDGSE